jgi:hypothetical protein
MNSITIGNITINQSANGLYLLTDLWKASGGLKKDQPNKWLNLDSTKKYLLFLDTKTENINTVYHEKIIGRGKIQGTYVCNYLVYSYAMWISCEYHHLVVATFLMLCG